MEERLLGRRSSSRVCSESPHSRISIRQFHVSNYFSQHNQGKSRPRLGRSKLWSLKKEVAERVGFEPTVAVKPLRFSRPLCTISLTRTW